VNQAGYGGWGLYSMKARSGLLENNLVYRTTDASMNQKRRITPPTTPTPTHLATNYPGAMAQGRKSTAQRHQVFYRCFEQNICTTDLASISDGYWYCEDKTRGTGYFQRNDQMYSRERQRRRDEKALYSIPTSPKLGTEDTGHPMTSAVGKAGRRQAILVCRSRFR